jgi:hypothetical protein
LTKKKQGGTAAGALQFLLGQDGKTYRKSCQRRSPMESIRDGDKS